MFNSRFSQQWLSIHTRTRIHKKAKQKIWFLFSTHPRTPYQALEGWFWKFIFENLGSPTTLSEIKVC